MANTNTNIMDKWVKPLLGVIASTAIIGLGVCLYVYADLGGDSITVFEDGLGKTLGTRLGTAAYLYAATVILLDLLFAREKVGWTTIVNTLFTGTFINLFDTLLSPYLQGHSLLVRWILMLLGLLCIVLSIVILIRFQQGMNALDALAWTLSEKTPIPYKVIRILMDAFLIVVGYLMGGEIGIGSLVGTVGLGPAVSFLNDLLNKKRSPKKR
ncbi:MAG: hypothetical protein IJ091_02770 [Oscillospiraceae bacterium]|nr:hypothetical protein [Oscillospiraceae bacterium]